MLGRGNVGSRNTFVGQNYGSQVGRSEVTDGGAGGKPTDGGMVAWGGEAGEPLTKGLALPLRLT